MNHPIEKGKVPTKILYGENDNLIDFDCVQKFVKKYDCSLNILKKGEHWFNTEYQLDALSSWIEKEIVLHTIKM